MIEINLLPKEMQAVEGTPPARLLTIIGGVVVAGVLGFFIASYYMVHIPNINREINNRNVEITSLTAQKKNIEEVVKKIDQLNKKVATLDELILSRVRFARILDRLCNAMPAEGVWFRSFNVQVQAGGARGGGLGASKGKKYQINLSGNVIAATENDRAGKLAQLISNLKQQLEVRDNDPNYVSPFLGARFESPQVPSISEVTSIAQPNEKDPDVQKTLMQYASKNGLDFNMTIKFEVPGAAPAAKPATPAPAAPKK